MLICSGTRNKFSTFFRNIIYGEGVNPLKWKIILPVFFVSFFATMVFNMVFPFLPKLIKSFGVSEVDAGYKVGVAGASVFIGRFFGSFIWGHLSDICNRKYVAIVSGLATAITTLAFGFTFNYTWAVVTRLLQGFSSGLMVIAKAMLQDMTDDTNRHLGMTLILSSHNTATVIGSSIGGFLAFPVEQYPNVFQGANLFDQFGVLLPCLVPFTCLLISCMFVWIYVPKSVKERGFVLSTILFAIYSFAAVGYAETFPIYAATSKRYHGFGFSPSLIGTCLIVVSVVTLIMQFTLIPKIVKRFGPRKTFLYANLIKAALLPMIPIMEMVIENEYLFWTLLLICMVIIRITMASSFLSINLIVNNSVDFSLLGTANGIALSTSTLGRAISVPLSGALYSWSLTNVKNIKDNPNALGFPFDHHVVFLLFAVISLACAIYTLILPKTLDHRYKQRNTITTVNSNKNKNVARRYTKTEC